MRKYEINGDVQGGFYMEMIFMIYMAWAIYSGYKVMSGRSEWLDKRAPVNMIVKFIVSTIVGFMIAVVYLVYLVFKLAGIIS